VAEERHVAVAELFADDGIHRSSPTKPAHVGRDAIAASWRRATATQEELELQCGTPIIDGERVAVEWWAVMRDPERSSEPSSDAVTLPGCLLLRFGADGRCTELCEYSNTWFGASLFPPPGWGT